MHYEEIVGMVVLKMSGEGRDEVEDLVGDDDDVHDGDDEHDDAVEDDGKGLADQSMWYDKEIHRILAMGMFRGMLVMYIVEACDGDCPNQLTIISSMSYVALSDSACKPRYLAYKFFLRAGKDLKKYGEWAVVTGATAASLTCCQRHCVLLVVRKLV